MKNWIPFCEGIFKNSIYVEKNMCAFVISGINPPQRIANILFDV